MPSDLPILYSGPMVRAIIAKMKRMTRRLSGLETVNLEPDAWALTEVDQTNGVASFVLKGKIGDEVKGRPGHRWTSDTMVCKSRQGGIGDTHWIRETWCPANRECSYPNDGRPRKDDALFEFAWYQATEANIVASDDDGMKRYDRSPWKPSIHMPRWVSRLSTRVTGVKVERLQSIPWYDIKAEGIACPEHDGPGMMCVSECASLRAAFVKLWDGINSDSPYASNPWVRATSFEVIDARTK